MPVMLVGMALIFGYSGGVAIQVGVYGDFTLNGGEDINVIHYDSLADLRRDVANRRLEMGYAITNGENIAVTVYTSPVTLTDRVVNLLFAATMLERQAGDIGANSIAAFLDADAAAIQARVNEFLADGVLMERNIVNLNAHLSDGQAHQLNEQTAATVVPFRRLFHGLLALFAQLTAMLCAIEFTKKSEKAIATRIKNIGSRPYITYCLAGWLAIFTLTAVVMTAAILPVSVLLAGTWVLGDIVPFASYLLVVSAVALLLTKTPQSVYPSVLVVSFIFTALLGGIIFDLREVLQEWAFLRLMFPSSYYMEWLSL